MQIEGTSSLTMKEFLQTGWTNQKEWHRFQQKVKMQSPKIDGVRVGPSKVTTTSMTEYVINIYQSDHFSIKLIPISIRIRRHLDPGTKLIVIGQLK